MKLMTMPGVLRRPANVRTANKKNLRNSMKVNTANGYQPHLHVGHQYNPDGRTDYVVVRCGTTGNRSRLARITGWIGDKYQVSR